MGRGDGGGKGSIPKPLCGGTTLLEGDFYFDNRTMVPSIGPVMPPR